ncbi:DUF2849 domain-containing protein [Niveispirillum sp. KHB5.9]|uniref:DUF2849 domain-containing protein n=1 Tax=Niveispirillum sp. KHB5.9 TaxID=3400269 RepID=UPI003A8B1C9C
MLVKAKGARQSVAASRLLDGEAVWLGAGNAWVERVAEAAVFDGADAIAEALAFAKAEEKRQVVVDVYPLDVEVTEEGTRPTHLRERLKGIGPTVRRDLGKQAVQAPAR